MSEVEEEKEALVELLQGTLRQTEGPKLKGGGFRENWGNLKKTLLSKWRLSFITEEVGPKPSWKKTTKQSFAKRLKKLFKHQEYTEKEGFINPPIEFVILDESQLPNQQSTNLSYELLDTSNAYMDMEPNIYMQPIIYLEPISVTYTRVLSSLRAWPLPQDCETPPRPPRQPPPPPSRPTTPSMSSPKTISGLTSLHKGWVQTIGPLVPAPPLNPTYPLISSSSSSPRSRSTSASRSTSPPSICNESSGDPYSERAPPSVPSTSQTNNNHIFYHPCSFCSTSYCLCVTSL